MPDIKCLINYEVIEMMRDAQLRYLRDSFLAESEGEIDHSKHSDDGYDYLKGALRLALDLTEALFEHDIVRVRRMLDPNSDEYIFGNYACDGICPLIYEALPTDEHGDVLLPEDAHMRNAS